MEIDMIKSASLKKQARQSLCYANFAVLYDADGLPHDCRFREASPAMQALLSTSCADIIGKTLGEVFPKLTDQADDSLQAILEQTLRTGSAEFEQYWMAQNTWIHVLALSGEQGTINAVFSDQTEQKKVALALKDANERFVELFNSGTDAAIIVRKRDGRIVAINSSFLSLSHFSREELIRKSIAGLGLFTRLNADTGEPEQVVNVMSLDQAEVSICRKDGSSFDGLISAKAVPLWGSKHVCIYIRDISIHKQSDEALEDLSPCQ